MKRQAQRDTKPELELRRALHARGLRFRVDRSPVAGMRARADIVFGPARVAVFVDGCFWHSCPEHATVPAKNREWWTTKLASNVVRDRRVDAELVEIGWLPFRVWEHDDSIEAAMQIDSLVTERRAARRRDPAQPDVLEQFGRSRHRPGAQT